MGMEKVPDESTVPLSYGKGTTQWDTNYFGIQSERAIHTSRKTLDVKLSAEGI